MWTDDETNRWKRHLRAMVRSAAEGDPEAFATLVALSETLNRDGLCEAYAGLRAQGFSAAEIARPLGVTRQAVNQRYAKR